jgi:magnesium transporter
MMTVHRWDCSAHACNRVPTDRLPGSAAEVTGGDVIWVDLSDPTPDEEAAVFERFLKVHALTLEDVTRPRLMADHAAHFPKVEEFPDYLLVIVNPLPPGLAEAVVGKMPEPGGPAPLPKLTPARLLRRENRPQLSAILTRNVLITHHYRPLGCVGDVIGFLDRHGTSAGRGPDYLFHLLLDNMVDEYAPVVDRVAARLDRLEARVFRDPSPKVLARMLRLKRLVIGLRKTLILEREVLARLTRGEFALVEAREIAYYRNVYDHLVRYTELIEAAREMVSDLMQTHLSAVSNRLNEIMKVLAMISTIVLPMTLIAGIYGMNFRKGMPELDWAYGYPYALGLMVLTGITSFILFRWKRWI